MMNPIESIVTCFRKYAVFSGRASRSECLWFLLFNYLMYNALKFISQNGLADMLSVKWMTITAIFNLCIILPTISVQVRRLHDVGRSGWWVGALYGGYPIVYILDALVKNSDPVNIPFAIGVLVFSAAVVIAGTFLIIHLLFPTNSKGDRYAVVQNLDTPPESLQPERFQPVEYIPQS